MPSILPRTKRGVRIWTAITSALVTLVLVCIWGTCSTRSRDVQHSPADTPTAPPSDPVTFAWTNSPQEFDVQEAAFRYQLARNGSSGTATERVTHYFLALGAARQDPPVDLLSRFESHDPAVVPASSADTSNMRVTHKDHGGHGVLLHIERIRPIDADTLDVDGGYYEAGLSASGNTYRVRRRGDSWEVVGDTMWWIS